MTNQPDNCPQCKTTLQGEPIPAESIARGSYGEGVTHFRREVGMEIPGVYDGVLYWFCPACTFAWAREFPVGYGGLQKRSQEYVDSQNARRLQPSG